LYFIQDLHVIIFDTHLFHHSYLFSYLTNDDSVKYIKDLEQN